MATRIELETEIEAESKKATRSVGWGCDVRYRDAGGRPTTLAAAAYIEVTVSSDAGFSKVVSVATSEGKDAEQLTAEFLQPTIDEVARRRAARGTR